MRSEIFNAIFMRWWRDCFLWSSNLTIEESTKFSFFAIDESCNWWINGIFIFTMEFHFCNWLNFYIRNWWNFYICNRQNFYLCNWWNFSEWSALAINDFHDILVAWLWTCLQSRVLVIFWNLDIPKTYSSWDLEI